jgi:hypothetical protein
MSPPIVRGLHGGIPSLLVLATRARVPLMRVLSGGVRLWRGGEPRATGSEGEGGAAHARPAVHLHLHGKSGGSPMLPTGETRRST